MLCREQIKSMKVNLIPSQPNMNGKKILIVGPYNPRKCGIATHTFQLAMSLKNKGWFVDILSPHDCEGNYHGNLIGGLRLLKLLKYSKKYTTINIHFTPEEFFLYVGYNPMRLFNIVPMLSFLVLFKLLKNINIVIHEPPLTKYFFQRTILHRLIWKQVPQITFFTNIEREIFEKRMRISFRPDQCHVENITNNLLSFSNLTKNDARLKLNIDQNKIIFLCIGFIAESKGFDRIAKLFLETNFSNSILYITGSVRLENDKKSNDYLCELKKICDIGNNIYLLNKYLSYEDFDLWTIASDYIVFPYRTSSNSGVLGRAKIFNKIVIASDVGGLREQIENEDYLFSDDTELQNIILKINCQNQN